MHLAKDYSGFCASITYELNLPEKLDDYWKGVLGSKNKCTNYFQRYLLPAINSPVAIGLDEVDEVFKHPIIAADFFGLLRAWHERSKNETVWKNLRLVIVHSKEVYIPLNTIKLWNLNLDDLLAQGCSWLKGYLASHPGAAKVCPRE